MPRTLVCLSHLAWDHVYQRPQHLMSRLAADWPVIFMEEPRVADGGWGSEVREVHPGVTVLRPLVPPGATASEILGHQRRLLTDLLERQGCADPILWYYTPEALTFTRNIESTLRVYDCMDELTAFVGAPPELALLERELAQRVELFFTGGRSLAEAKRELRPDVHCFPSSVDREHFARARDSVEPADQASIPHPRLGYCGVIDERMDMVLLDELARRRPAWQIVLLGPIAKIAPEAVPSAPNIHHLGQRPYADLPAYLAGWDVGLMPFALNEATRFISPTKTPEYLAAGLPVVSTAIADVVEPYGHLGLAHIVGSAEEAVRAVEDALAEDADVRMGHADAYLRTTSWDRTAEQMRDLIDEAEWAVRREAVG
jgi:glycosyltransferase involved in cell wall biosynthesis